MNHSTDSVFTSKKKTALLAAGAIAVGILFAVAGANAYPGATAREIETSIQVKSICHAVDASGSNMYWYGYREAGAKPDAKNQCPSNFSVSLQSNPRLVKDRMAVEAVDAISYFQYVSEPPQNRYWTTDYSIVIYENGQQRVQYMMSEADFDGELKSLLTASESTPVQFKVNYVARKVEPAVRIDFAEHEKVIKVIGTCRIYGSQAVYLMVRATEKCDDGFQFSVAETGEAHAAQSGSHSQITVYSQFGVKLFTSELLRGARRKLDLDLRTASPTNPVLVKIDTKNKRVLKIEPSISPYAL